MLGAPGRGLSPSEQTELLGMVNSTIDEWSSRRPYVYAWDFPVYPITPAHQPHLLGPGLLSPDWAGNRLMSIDPDGIALVLSTVTPPVDVPIVVRDAEWWNNQRVKSITTSVPTSVYYEPTVPNGSFWLWPVPSFGYSIRLRVPLVVQQFTSTTQTITLPPAFYKALVLTLAEAVADYYGLPVPPGVPQRAARARYAVQSANSRGQRVGSTDVGVTSSRAGGATGGGFNYYSGM